MEWKLFEECKGYSWECDIHELERSRRRKRGGEVFCLFHGVAVEEKKLNALSRMCRVIRITPPRSKSPSSRTVVSYDESR